MLRASIVTSWLAFFASPAAALTVSDFGTQGAPGADGESVAVVAVSADASNSATGVGGRGGDPGAAATSGGDAAATAETQTSGGAVAFAKATGGVGGDGLADLTAGPGGDALASAVAENTNAESVQVTAQAYGGQGGPFEFSPPGNDGPGGDGGSASRGSVHGASTGGGQVTVEATAAGGDGGRAGPGKTAGAGAPIALDDAVDGDTSGSLILRQYAIGGSSGDGLDPSAGSAESHLTRAKSASSLELVTEATAGGRTGQFYDPTTRHGGSGVGANASVAGSNEAGSLQVRAAALAGSGSRCFPESCPSPTGGNATASASAETQGDGHAILIGKFPDGPPVNGFPTVYRYGAYGGNGGPSLFGSVDPGRGGDATSSSAGTALGNSSVEVHDYAEGGAGGDFSFGPFLVTAVGAPGGSATSSASAQGAGESQVAAHSAARGGPSSIYFGTSPALWERGGDAHADASAQGAGEVHAEATATGGGSWFGPGNVILTARSLGGEAHALASAQGPIGSASSLAVTSGDTVLRMGIGANASLLSQVSVEAHASSTQAFDPSPAAGGGDVIGRAVVTPLAADIDQVFAAHAALADAFESAEVDQYLGLGRIDMRSSQLADTGSILLSSSVDFDIAVSTVALPGFPGPRSAWIGFFESGVAGDGFESLRIRLANNEDLILDVLLTDPDAVALYLDEAAVDLGQILASFPPTLPTVFPTGHLTLDLDLMVRDVDDSFGVGFIIGSTPIPEPGTALLLAVGIAVLAARARRQRALI